LNQGDVIKAMEEQYPADLRTAGVGGRVTVGVLITEEGVVQDVRVDEASGHVELDRAALAVAGQMCFTPAKDGDKPVAVWLAMPITFQVR